MSPVQPPLDSTFPGLSPFPNTVPTAPLLRISLAKLLRGDVKEEEQLWSACCDLGFFYLDLRAKGNETIEVKEAANGYSHSNGGEKEGEGRAVDGESLLADAEKLFKVGEEFFNLSVEEKQKYDFADKGSYFGYVCQYSPLLVQLKYEYVLNTI
jgi:hypothetical protein